MSGKKLSPSIITISNNVSTNTRSFSCIYLFNTLVLTEIVTEEPTFRSAVQGRPNNRLFTIYLYVKISHTLSKQYKSLTNPSGTQTNRKIYSLPSFSHSTPGGRYCLRYFCVVVKQNKITILSNQNLVKFNSLVSI